MTVERTAGDRIDNDTVLAAAPPYLPIVVSSDEIQFRTGPWSGPVVSMTDEYGDGRLGELAMLLDGSRRLADILDQFEGSDRTEVGQAIAGLYDDGVVVDIQKGPSDSLRGYRAVDPTIEGDGQSPSGSVLVVNSGQIGRMVADDLSGLSFDRLSMLTRSSAEPGEGTAGTDGAIDRLPSDTTIRDAVQGMDYVVYTTDRPDNGLGRRVNRITFDQGIPSISARLLGLDGQIGPTVIPGHSACYDCYDRRARATMAAEYTRGMGKTGSTGVQPLPAHARILAGWLVTDLVRLVGAGTGFTVGGVIHFDFFDMTIEPNPVLKLPRCPTCGVAEGPRVDVKRFVDHDRLLEDDR